MGEALDAAAFGAAAAAFGSAAAFFLLRRWKNARTVTPATVHAHETSSVRPRGSASHVDAIEESRREVASAGGPSIRGIGRTRKQGCRLAVCGARASETSEKFGDVGNRLPF